MKRVSYKQDSAPEDSTDASTGDPSKSPVECMGAGLNELKECCGDHQKYVLTGIGPERTSS